MLILLLGKYILWGKQDGVPITCFWYCGEEDTPHLEKIFVYRKMLISNQMILCIFKVGIQLMATLFFQ